MKNFVTNKDNKLAKLSQKKQISISISFSMGLLPVTVDNVEQMVRKLRPKKSCGIDIVSNLEVKRSSRKVYYRLTALLNAPKKPGVLHDIMKGFKVAPNS